MTVQQIREWTLAEEIGRGAIGVIYRATHKYLKGEYAVKALRSSMVGNDSARMRFLREAETAAALKHPNIVETLPAFEVGGRLYLPMEMLRGNSLLALIDATRDQWSYERVRYCAAQAAAGLGFAHDKEVLHRDVKPSNLMVLDDGRTVKVLDFGLAKSMDAKKLTATGAAVGTPLYMAPELLDGDPASKQTDVYAFGMVLFRLLTGRMPFDSLPNENIWKLVSALRLAQMRGFPAPSAFRQDVPRDLDTLTSRMLSQDPLQRPLDAREVASILAPALARPCVIAPAAGLLDESSSAAPPSQPGAFQAMPQGDAEATPSTLETPVARPGGQAIGFEDTLPTRSAPDAVETKGTIESFPAEPAVRQSPRYLSAVIAAALVLLGFGLSLALRNRSAATTSPAAVRPSASWLAVEGGVYTLGSNDGAMSEAPPHDVTLEAFELTSTEITVAQFTACVAAGECSRKHYLASSDDSACNYGAAKKTDHPMNCVSWFGAAQMCRSMSGARLPTEAEWEAAARGTDGRRFPWGAAAPTCAVAVLDDEIPGCGKEGTWPVGAKLAGGSSEGLLDMSGNVAEWVADRYASSYEICGPECAGVSPSGPAQGTHRVLRGGSWGDRGEALRAAARRGAYPDLKSSTNGFRCARSGS